MGTLRITAPGWSAANRLRDWSAGTMKSREDVVVVVGMDTFPETLLKLFNGENFGKLVLQVAKE